MLSECFNPNCRTELRYLRSGRVVRVLRHETDQTVVEHFWLCGSCYATLDFAFDYLGAPQLTTKFPLQIAADLELWENSSLPALTQRPK